MANIRDLFCTTPKVLKLHKVIFGNNKKYWAEEIPEGAHTLATRVGGAPTPTRRAPTSWDPWWPSGAHLLLYEVSYPGKKKIEAFGTKRRRLKAEPGQDQSRAPTELFYRGNIPPGGGNLRHRHHHWSSHREGVHLHQHLHQHHILSNPSSSLVSDLCLKTSYWYPWVASSVDYIS